MERNHLTLLAATDAGYRNLVKLSSAGFLEGLQRGKPTVDLQPDRAPLRRRDRADRLSGLALLSAPARGSSRRRARPRRRSAADLRRGERLLRGAEERARRAGEVQRGDRADRPRARRQPGRHRRRPLPAPRGLRPPHRAAVRADQEHDRRAEADVRHQRVLPARQRGDGRRVRAVAGGDREHAGDRRALLGRARARQAADPQLPDARRRQRARVPARARARGPAACATATRRPRRRSSGWRWSST